MIASLLRRKSGSACSQLPRLNKLPLTRGNRGSAIGHSLLGGNVLMSSYPWNINVLKCPPIANGSTPEKWRSSAGFREQSAIGGSMSADGRSPAIERPLNGRPSTSQWPIAGCRPAGNPGVSERGFRMQDDSPIPRNLDFPITIPNNQRKPARLSRSSRRRRACQLSTSNNSR
jgi:hypothetical protein